MFIWIAVRLVFMSFVICQFSVSIPLLFSTYSSASNHALSYAFVTSRYTICVAMLSFSIVRWPAVDLLSLPPACASDIVICGRVRLPIIRSHTFPMLLDIAIPLSFEHLGKKKSVFPISRPTHHFLANRLRFFLLCDSKFFYWGSYRKQEASRPDSSAV